MRKRSSLWHQSPNVNLGPRYDETSGERAAWAATLARVLANKPDGVDLFVRAGFAGVVVQIIEGRDGGESGPDLDAKCIASITVHGADCGDP